MTSAKQRKRGECTGTPRKIGRFIGTAISCLAIVFALSGLPCAQSLRLDIGNDTGYEWSAPIAFTGPQRLSIASDVNRYVAGCWCIGCIYDFVSGNCTVPLVFRSDVSGNFTIDDIRLTFESDANLGEVGYGSPFRKSEGGCWEIEGPSGIFMVPIPSDYDGGSCSAAEYSYTRAANARAVTDDAVVDATYRLLNESLDTQPSHGRLDGADGFAGDPAAMSFRTEGRIGVQSLWGPVRMRLVVWG
ncbi:MAG: hypothetical protein V1875_01780 [Candidatus Altiarchaeota archaeon]